MNKLLSTYNLISFVYSYSFIGRAIIDIEIFWETFSFTQRMLISVTAVMSEQTCIYFAWLSRKLTIISFHYVYLLKSYNNFMWKVLSLIYFFLKLTVKNGFNFHPFVYMNYLV